MHGAIPSLQDSLLSNICSVFVDEVADKQAVGSLTATHCATMIAAQAPTAHACRAQACFGGPYSSAGSSMGSLQYRMPRQECFTARRVCPRQRLTPLAAGEGELGTGGRDAGVCELT